MKAETIKRPQRNIPVKAKYKCFITFKSRLIYGSDMHIDIGYYSQSCASSTNNLKVCFSTLIPVLYGKAYVCDSHAWDGGFVPLTIFYNSANTHVLYNFKKVSL